MKVFYTSDCHFDFDKTNESLNNFISLIQKNDPTDLLIIAGDISNNRKERIKILKLIDSSLRCQCFFVIGNHDFWNIEEYYSIGDSKFIDEVFFLKNIKFNNINVIDNEIIEFKGLRISGSSGYWRKNKFEYSTYLPRELSSLKESKLKENTPDIYEKICKILEEYDTYYEKKFNEWIDIYEKNKNNIDICITHQPTWVWMDPEEKLLNTIKYINGHDHYKLDTEKTKRVKGKAFLKTAENNYNDGQNTYFGKYKKPLKFFEI